MKVYTAGFEAPFGKIYAASTERELIKLSFRREEFLSWLDKRGFLVEPHENELLIGLKEELKHYFAGKLRRFKTPYRLLVSEFDRRVLDVVAKIPYGETLSYREVALRAGFPRAFRAAGGALGRNPLPIIVPCHRVIRSDGGLGGFGGGIEIKKYLLELEGALPPAF